MSERSEQILRVMASMGFNAKAEIDARYVEFFKDYAEPHGRTARCTVMFDKGGMFAGIDQARLAGYVVTVQGVVDPVEEEVKTKAPRVMHGDMFRVLNELGGSVLDPVELATIECAQCGARTGTWTQGDICPKCAEVS